MSRSTLRTAAAVAVLAVLLLPGAAWAGETALPATPGEPGFAAILRGLLGMFLGSEADNGWGIDPNGATATACDNRWGIDPNGGDACSANDNRWTIDPDG